MPVQRCRSLTKVGTQCKNSALSGKIHCHVHVKKSIKVRKQTGGQVETLVDEEGSRWYLDGKLHREGDLPAWIDADGDQWWFQNGLRHRDGDQPAWISQDESTKEWYQNGKLHRDGDQPAVIGSDGTKEWYQNGKLHRDGDQPAIIEADGAQEWRQEGKRHREGGQPAVIKADGTKQWWINGQRVTQKQQLIEVPPSIKKQPQEKQSPEVINIEASDGTVKWFKQGKLHRDTDNPSRIRSDGTEEWFKDGKRHREGKPAVVYADGKQEWWVNGVQQESPQVGGCSCRKGRRSNRCNY